MTINIIRDKFVNYYKKNNHKLIPSAPLVLKDDQTTLFTSSGMQPLVPYLLGAPHKDGKRLVNSQPSLRVQDIDEVGDNRHTTFFEMLGNWSLGDYFKKEQITWVWNFLINELNLPKEKLYVSVFEGYKSIPFDEESKNIWISLGVRQDHIFHYGVKKNWWSRSGTPDEMPEGEIGGPDSEIFFEFTNVKHDPKFGTNCHPNCDCGRFLEIGNSVFIQYKKVNGDLVELPQKNVDFGGGLERLLAAVKDEPDIFLTSAIYPIIETVQKWAKVNINENKKDFRIIADHIKASVFLISNEVLPSNKLQGSVLRRLLRRSFIKMKNLRISNETLKDEKIFLELVNSVFDIYNSIQETPLSGDELNADMSSSFRGNPDRKVVGGRHKNSYFNNSDPKKIASTIKEESDKFLASLDRGLKVLEKTKFLNGKEAFDLYQSYGFPLELTLELAQEKGLDIDVNEFKKEFEKHQEKSRTQSAGVFKGGLIDNSKEVTMLHTATHLIHAALRKILGDSVSQKGSNITKERLRFDFSYPQKLSKEDLEKIENLVNEQIKKSLPVTCETKSFKQSQKEGALAFFKEKYAKDVKVYTIGDVNGDWFSKEVCGGPHVENTKELNRVRIIKEEAASSGVRRIYAVLEK